MPQIPTQTQLDQIFDQASFSVPRRGTTFAVLQDNVDSLAQVIVAVWALEAEVTEDYDFWGKKLQVAIKLASLISCPKTGLDLISLVADKLLK